MKETAPRSIIKTGSGADLAFSLVVLASYFATFSVMDKVNPWGILVTVLLGTSYTLMGIYGYRYCAYQKKEIFQLLYFLIQIPIACLIIFLGGNIAFNAMIFLPLAGHSVILLSRRWMAAANIVILVSYMCLLSHFSYGMEEVWSAVPIFLTGQVFIVFFTQMAVNEEYARSEVERLFNELAEANQRLREYSAQVEELAIFQERNRLAREIHDGLGHYLTAIFMQVQAAGAVMEKNPDRAREALSRAQSLAQDALVDVRQSVAALRTLPGENLPLPERIKKLFQNCDAAGIVTDLVIQGKERLLPPQAQVVIYRAVQEAVSNTCKHSKAKKMQVGLEYLENEKVHLMIWDDGKGAQSIDGGFGLIGLQERVHQLNGDFRIMTGLQEGFTIEIEVPG